MKLSIIIPCYNESRDIAKNAEIVKDFLKQRNIDYELILVNDGSKDETQKVIDSISGAISLGYEINRGKGGAVKYGIEHSTGDYILFMDSDLSTDLSSIDEVIKLAPESDIIIGSRHTEGSVLKKKQPLIRRFIGWCCRKIVNLKFGTHYKDTQCGFKAIKADLAKKIVSKQLVNDFAFDVEYVYIAKLNQINVKEIGVTWADDRGSTVSPFKSSMRFLKDLRRIKKNRKEYYFTKENKEKDKETSRLPIVIMILLFFLLIGLFITFLLIKGHYDSSNSKDEQINEKLNNRFLGLINKQITFNAYDEDIVKNIQAVTIEENYPTSYTLKITASSDIKVYFYETTGAYKENEKEYTNLTSYLLVNDEEMLGSSSLTFNEISEEKVNSDKSPNYIVSKNNVDELYVSGFYFESETYHIYLKASYDKNNDPFLGTANEIIDKNSQLFSYYSYLTKWQV